MRVLVDTSVWSLALRRRPEALGAADAETVARLTELLREDRVVMLGPIRQELLSGLRIPETFETLRLRLEAFIDVPLERDDHVEAARAFNACRAEGINGSAIDLLLAATAIRHDWAVFTTDRDFEYYARVLPLRLF
jgi:predicted nucleic acid-binding protein